MYFISYKCIVGEVGSYFQLAVTFFFDSPYQTRQCSTSVHFDLPFPQVWIHPCLYVFLFDSFYAICLLLGLQFLHENGMVYRCCVPIVYNLCVLQRLKVGQLIV